MGKGFSKKRRRKEKNKKNPRESKKNVVTAVQPKTTERVQPKQTAPVAAKIVKPPEQINDPNPGKTPLERLLWNTKLSSYYSSLKKAGYDKRDLTKLSELAKDRNKFNNVCEKAGMKYGHIRRLHLAIVSPDTTTLG
mmetsp:Transcript_16188/g.24415  ORF Transcript_16188/g.24415 Transcript_16188/m.24415 type:complete len:137 (+) Transcript_16188:47-457(+)